MKRSRRTGRSWESRRRADSSRTWCFSTLTCPKWTEPKVADAIRRDPFLELTPILFLTPLAGKKTSPSFIPKPVSPAELIEHVEKALADSHAVAAR